MGQLRWQCPECKCELSAWVCAGMMAHAELRLEMYVEFHERAVHGIPLGRRDVLG